jgi:hypothetical protein
MTKNTAKPDVMTDDEILAGIEKSLRNQRLKAALRSKLLSQREKLLKKMGRGQTDTASAKDGQQILAEMLGERSVLELSGDEQRNLVERLGEERAVQEIVQRIEAENRAKAQPKGDARPKPGMTAAEIKSFYAGVGQVVPAVAQPPIPIADVD